MIIDSPIISGSYAATGSLNQVGDVTITGSLRVTGAIIGAVTGSVDSASFATNASLLNNSGSGEFVPTGSFNTFSSSILTYTGSNNTNISNIHSTTASLNTFTGSANSRLSSLETTSGSNITRIGALETASGSAITRLNALEASTGSLYTFTGSASSRLSSIESTTGSLNTASGSAITRLNALEVTSGSNITRISALENASGSAITRLSSIESTTGSLNTASGSAITRLDALETASGSAITRLNSIESTTGSLNAASGSAISRLNSIESTTGSLNTASGSAITRLSSLESKTGSYATTGSNTFVGGQYISQSSNPTGFTTTASLYTDGGLRVGRDAYISGTLYLNNVTVYGTQSISYISSSQLNIGTNIISVNTDTPSVRFGGLAVYDSGSTGLTGSILWDSQNNHWVYSNPSGSTYSGGMFISGPRTSTLGSETGTTSCMLLAGQGGDHLTSSMIYHSSTATCIPTAILGGSTACFASSVTSLSNNFIATTNAYTTQGTVSYNDARGLISRAKTATVYDFSVYSADESSIIVNPTGTTNVAFPNGNVGVGTITPGEKLQVDGSNVMIKLNAATDTFAQLGYYENGTLKWNAYNNYANDNYQIGNSGGTYFTITSTGVTCFSNQICAQGATFTTTGNTAVTIASGATGLSRLIFQGTVGNARGFIDYDNSTCGFIVRTNESTALTISNTGVACFASTVCAPSFIGGTISGTTFSGTTLYGSTAICGGVVCGTNATFNGVLNVNPGAVLSRINLGYNFCIENDQSPEITSFINSSGTSIFRWMQGVSPVEKMRLSNLGYLGIGATSPVTNLHICNNTNAGLRIQAAGSNGSSELDLLSHGTQNAFIDFGPNRLVFRSTNCDMTAINDGNVLVLNNNGCVGINTSTPRSVLHVQQASNDGVPAVGCARDGLIISSNNGNYGLNIGVDPTGPTWIESMRFDDGATAYNLLLQAAGRCSVLIGTGTALAGCRQQLVIGGNSFGSLIALGNNGNGNKFVIESDSSENVLINNKSNTPMIFYTNNSRRMDITGDGYVGIGCTSPGAQLVVYGACNGDTTLHLQNGSVSGKITFSNNTANSIYGGGWYGYMGYNSATFHYFGQPIVLPLCTTNSQIRTGDIEIQSYDTNNSWIASNTYFDGSGFKNRSTGFASQIYLGNTNGEIRFLTGNSSTTAGSGSCLVNAFRLHSSGVACFACTVCAPTAIIAGAVGIGVTSPSQCLEVSGIIKSSGVSNSIMFTNRNCSTATWEWYSQGTPGSGFAGLYKNHNTSGTPLVITDSGNVGIGTSSPTTKLEVIGGTTNVNGYSDGSIQVTGLNPIAFVAPSNLNPSLNRWGFSLREVTDGDFSIRNYRQSTTPLIIKDDGKIGIGTTSPNETLDVNGTIQVRGTSAGYATTQCVTQLDFYAGAARLLSFGGNSTTCGGFRFYSAGQNNSGGSDVVTISGGGVTCFRASVCIASGTLYLPGAIGGRTSQIEFGNSGTADILGMPNLTTTFYLKYGCNSILFSNDNGGEILRMCNNKTIAVNGPIVPTSNGTIDLGTSSLRWCTVYTSDLSLSNGIGDYTMVEGENDLFLYNNKQCKVYKFMLQEVCPEIAPAKRST
jgi:hypothetical protein